MPDTGPPDDAASILREMERQAAIVRELVDNVNRWQRRWYQVIRLERALNPDVPLEAVEARATQVVDAEVAALIEEERRCDPGASKQEIERRAVLRLG